MEPTLSGEPPLLLSEFLEHPNVGLTRPPIQRNVLSVGRADALKAKEAIHLLEQLPIEMLEADSSLVSAAAEVKINYAVSYANAFFVVMAMRHEGTVLTSDPEFRAALVDSMSMHSICRVK